MEGGVLYLWQMFQEVQVFRYVWQAGAKALLLIVQTKPENPLGNIHFL